MVGLVFMPDFGLVNLAQAVKEPLVEDVGILRGNYKAMYPAETHSKKYFEEGLGP